MVILMKSILSTLFACFVLFGCDSYPGPSLRNEFPGEIKVSVNYDDGSHYSENWPSCRTVAIGASEIGRFGLKARDVGVKSITVEYAGKIKLDLDKQALVQLLQRASEEKGDPIWILDPDGVHFSRQSECSLLQKKH